MAELFTYKVLRRHEGDRVYEEGETRDGTESDLGHLVPNVLRKVGPAKAEKAEPAPLNKAERAPANKADPLDHDSNGRKGGAAKPSKGAK